jgi:hypothetical protein
MRSYTMLPIISSLSAKSYTFISSLKKAGRNVMRLLRT